MNIELNTVSAENQVAFSSDVSLFGSPLAKTKILVLGNSITRHGPCPAIGWELDCGMAASAPEKDYVHRLYAKLQEAGKSVYMRVKHCSDWENGFLKEDALSKFKEDRAFGADIVVFRLGENVKRDLRPHFLQGLQSLIPYVCPTGTVVYTTCFWKNEQVDNAIRSFALSRNEVCLDGCLSDDESNMALGLFAHEGVAIHPGDKGMEQLASLIFHQLSKMI